MKKDCWNCKNDNQYAKFPCNYCNTENINDFWKPKDEMKEFAIAELEKIKAEMEKDKIILFYAPQKVEIFNEWIEKLDKRIAELKGE